MINLYESTCEDFNNNGIASLKDTIKCEITEELNGEYTVDFEYPRKSKYSEQIDNDMIIKIDAGVTERQLFRIKGYNKDLSTIKATPQHITYDLIDNALDDVYPQNLNGNAAIDWILTHTQYNHKFKGYSNISTQATARYVRKNPIEAIIGDLDNSFVKVWGGELERNNYNIRVLSKRGEDRGYKIKYAKNLTGIDFTKDDTSVITRLRPVGYDGLLLPEKYVDSSLINMKAKEEIYIEERGNEDWIYLSTYYKAEKNIAEKLIELREYKNINAIENLDRKLKKIEKTQKIELSDKQKEAVKLVNDNNVCVITGGPGTGKTTIIKSIIDIYKEEELKITLCAPTGRAAKRMTEATGEEAKTLHRVLEIGKFASEDEINPDLLVTPIDANVVIIDEASMIDLFLMNYLMKALYSGTKLILVGDENQLPSVGPGNVLKDIIASEKVPVVTLNKIFRQAAKSKIILNSHKVNEGESFIGIKQENEEELLQDFFFIQENNKENIIKQIVSLCTGRLERYGNYDFIKNIQVITPTKKGNLGTKELNQVIQSNVNQFETTKKEKKFGDTIFRQGDRIMQIKNNYDIFWERDGKTNEAGSGVFNGEFGTIIDINEMDKEIVIKFDDDKKAWYSYADLDQIEHAYAITVHKAQRK